VALAFAVLACSFVLSVWAPQWNVAAGDTAQFQHVILVTGMSMAIGFPFKAYAGILHARLRFDLVSIVGLVSMIFGTLATVLLISNGYGIVALAYVGLVSRLLADLVFLLLARREAPGLQVQRSLIDFSLVRELASFSASSFIIQISNQLRFQIDALVIGSIRSAAAVTQYSVGARLSEIPDGILYQATNVVQPLLTSYHAADERQRMLDALSLYTRVNVVLGVFVSGMLIMLGDAFIGLWMGQGYATSVLVLYSLTLTRCIGFMLNPIDNSLYAIGRIRVLALAGLMEAMVNVALSIWLGRRYGIVGVALGTLIPMIVTRLVFVAPYACKQLDWSMVDFSRTVGRPLLVGICVLCAIWLVFARVGWAVDGYASMALFALLSVGIYLPCVFFLGLSRIDRVTIADGLRSAFGRHLSGDH
jgi:O-antigen/teichoic acid export membrane protein